MNVLIPLILSGFASQERDFDKVMHERLERLSRSVDDASRELIRDGAISEQTRRYAQSQFDQLAFAFSAAMQDYQTGKRGWTDGMEQTKEFLNELRKAGKVQGDWLLKAAHRRMVPRLQKVLTGRTLAAPWSSCDGSEKECLTCQVRRRKL